MITWINEAKKKIQSLLTPEAYNHVFESGTTTRARRFDINSNRLRSYAAAVSQRFGNPQDSPTEVVVENPNDGMTEGPGAVEETPQHDNNIEQLKKGRNTYRNGSESRE